MVVNTDATRTPQQGARRRWLREPRAAWNRGVFRISSGAVRETCPNRLLVENRLRSVITTIRRVLPWRARRRTRPALERHRERFPRPLAVCQMTADLAITTGSASPERFARIRLAVPAPDLVIAGKLLQTVPGLLVLEHAEAVDQLEETDASSKHALRSIVCCSSVAPAPRPLPLPVNGPPMGAIPLPRGAVERADPRGEFRRKSTTHPR